MRSISDLQYKFDKIDKNLDKIVINQERGQSQFKFEDGVVTMTNNSNINMRAKSGKVRNDSKGFFYSRPMKTVTN